ncbi:uncharacterized protein isoform X2 [Leptinotarsa decemlineata]|uniref:uncharacterized protein isoform X2 n=1 Tax=Leptinotarsa decemlineata TaxID=7539 RepID=UPI003D30C962
MAIEDCGIFIKRELESVGDEEVFERNIMKFEISETEMVSESGKYMIGSEMVTHNFEEKVDMDQIKSEHVIDVYHEPKSEKSIGEITEGPQSTRSKTCKKKRVWNKKDYCYFCNNEVLKFSRHILRHHQMEHEVQEILSFSVGNRRRKELFTRLRNTGNFLKSSSSEIIVPVRKPAESDLEQPTTDTYLPCKFCKGFYKRKTLYRHIAKCPDNCDDKKLRSNAQSEGQSLFSKYKNNDILRKYIFPSMRADELSLTAKKDMLICAVAKRYLKSHRDKHFRAIASRKMRQLAALLIEIKKKIKVTNLFAALDPLNFDILVECTKIISRYNAETQSYGAPSLASHMGTELKECIDVASNMALKKYRQDNSDINKLKNLRELIDKEWRFEISTEANNDLKQKKWNKPPLIPLAEDLTTLKNYTLKEGERYRNVLQQNPHDKKSFKNLLEITYVQLLLLNRRRIGELEKMTVPSYITNINNQSSDEFNSCITENEKVLMKSFRRVVIRGKRGRGVPILFTDEMVKNTDLLLSLRNHFLLEENIFLFPNTKSSNSICGSKAIYKHVRLAGVKNAAALTSTRLRKHLATMSQVINLSPQDLEQLACFMGHTSEIHKAYYRLPSDVYQMAKVSKLLLLNERGKASKYKGKTLEEINIDLDIEEDDSEDDQNEESTIKNKCTGNRSTGARNIKQLDSSNKYSKVKKKRILQSWTDCQKKVALSFFKNHLKNKIPPKKKECLQLVNDNPGVFVNKSWEKIKIFVVNTYNKNK